VTLQQDCNALQHTTLYCNALQRTAMHCNALQRTTRTATHSNSLPHTVTHPATYVSEWGWASRLTTTTHMYWAYHDEFLSWLPTTRILHGTPNFLGKVVFICLGVSVNLVFKFQGQPITTTVQHDLNPNRLNFHRGSPWVSILSWLNLKTNKDYFSYETVRPRYSVIERKKKRKSEGKGER